MPGSFRLPQHGPLLAGLALTRIIGWGSIYYSPSVLAAYLDRDLDLGPAVVFSGVTILLVTGAAFSPALGRHLDQRGTRQAMCVGAVIAAIGLALLSQAQGPVSYLATWFVIGIGHAMQLANTGNVTVAQLMGERTRRVIGLMMLVSGLASSVFWPLTAALSAAYGWRSCLLIFAATQLLVVLPIHLAIPRYRMKPAGEAPEAVQAEGDEGRVPLSERRAIFWLMALSFSASGLVSWGLPLHVIGLMQSAGLSNATAVAIATLSGPATLAARAIDAVAGHRLPVERVALAGLALGPLSCLLMALAPGSPPVAIAFILLFNAAMGVIAVARATLPLALFGRLGFGSMLGRLAVPQNLTFAAAPLLFALMIERIGPAGALYISAAIQFTALLAMALLVRRLRG
ncbi:MFS transporter [Bosea sp. (in: a-proteobacteria)]|uniref:MFS transporter n=1 Tax=Bosea sp. (in: a-proteobacteria) TaxID=1871050 RepID=UPI001AD0234D|nr:MFS transporter [Bosea sp. (in: a-proteobacteria)]MBN9435455.1 MFS transporter [Bosea sp. (in: a-proteobacteria)]